MTRINWTLDSITSQIGKRFLVTGANSGIGYFTALELARKGATVLLACRSEARGNAAVRKIQEQVPGALVELLPLDLASFQSVRAACEDLLQEDLPLDCLVNNAGVMAPPQRLETVDGFELQFGTNVLGHFLLSSLLEPLLLKSEAPRIVSVASIAHKRGRIDFQDLQSSTDYSPRTSYSQSKLANLMLAREMADRFRRNESPIVSVACHPGVASTNLFVTGDYGRVEKLVRTILTFVIRLLSNSSLQGALPNLFAATSELASSGGYYGPQGFREMRGGDVGDSYVSKEARDEAACKQLWKVCEELTGSEFL